MFNKEERKALQQRFWSQFDEYCNTNPDLAWRKKKWILHDTKIGHVDLKFDLPRGFAMVALEINHRSEKRRLQVYELLTRYKSMLEQGFLDGLTWNFCFVNENKQEVCRVYAGKKGIDFHVKDDWVMIHQFFARNMLRLQDNFLEIQEALREEVHLLHREE